MQNNWKKNAAVFVASQLISLFGSSLVQYAITWHITLTTQSGVYAAIAIICGFLPTFFLSPFAGVWADRYDRKKLIVLADGAIALSTLALAVLFMLGHNAVWLLFVALGLRALGAAVQTPAISALLPSIVPEEQLTRVNGISQSLQSAAMLISPMLSGALLGHARIEMIFFIDVITAALAIAVMLLFLKVPRAAAAKTGEKTEYYSELKQGLRYIGGQKYLKSFFVLCALIYILIAPVSFLTPLQTARFYGDDVWRLTAIEMVFAVGMILGGILIAAWGGFKNRVVTMAVAVGAMGACSVLLGFPGPFWLYLGFMGIIGVFLAVYNTPTTVLLQENVAPEYMGRVFGVFTMLSSSMMPLGMLLFGPLADVVAIEWLLIFSGLGILAVCVALYCNKVLRAAGARQLVVPGQESEQ